MAVASTKKPLSAELLARRNRLTEEHMPLVHHVVRRMARRIPSHVDIDDLVAAGSEGLLRAAERFDEDRGVAFSTFAGCSIRGAVLDALRAMDPLARPTRRRVQALERAEASLAGQWSSSPSEDALAQAMDATPREVRDAIAMRRAASVVSLDEERTTGPLGHVLEDPRAVDVLGRVLLCEARDVVREEMSKLGESDRRVVVLYYAEGLLLREIAEILGVTEGRICQIHKRAIGRLRDAVRRRGLIDA